MGFLGGDNEQGNDKGSSLIDEQIANNAAEIENKKHNLYKTKLEIIKGQGGESWTPDRNGFVSKRS